MKESNFNLFYDLKGKFKSQPSFKGKLKCTHWLVSGIHLMSKLYKIILSKQWIAINKTNEKSG